MPLIALCWKVASGLRTRLFHSRLAHTTVTAIALFSSVACSLDKFIGEGKLPEEVVSPALTETPKGALAAYRGATMYLRDALAKTPSGYPYPTGFVVFVGQLSDELRFNIGAPLYYNLTVSPDHRQFDEEYEEVDTYNPYSALQRVRSQSAQAQGLLQDYPPDNPLPLIAHTLAMRAYAEVMLAELYCSGIPLSTLDYKGDFTYAPGLPTDSVLQHAVTLFDSALAIAGTDSMRIVDFARVGKGRALLQMGKFDEAAAAVVSVAPTFRYALQYSVAAQVRGLFGVPNSADRFKAGLLGDREGQNGMPFVSERDARLPQMDTFTYMAGSATLSGSFPRKGWIPVSGDQSVIVLSSGIEAQLIQAEVALWKNDASWLTILNRLRTTCTDVATCPTPAPRGTGGVDSLPLLEVPNGASMAAKIGLLFRERAYWLFLTGHRVGDLRRLIRIYKRDSEEVFPTGEYDSNVLAYGGDVNLPVPRMEQERNPKYNGCINRGA